MAYEDISAEIDAAWEWRSEISPDSKNQTLRDAVYSAIELLDSGSLRVATRQNDGAWTTHQWLKKAVLLQFRLQPNRLFAAQALLPERSGRHYDKIALKTETWGDRE